MRTTRWAAAALTVLAVGFGAAACGDDDDSPSSEAAPTSAASAPAAESTPPASTEAAASEPEVATSEATASESSAAESAPAGEVVTTLQAGSIGDWVTWDEASCSFQPAADHPDKWEGNLYKATTPWKFGFATQSETLASVLTDANEILKSNAEAAGVELVFGNNDFPSTTAPVSEAQRIAGTNPDAFGNFNVLEAVNAAVNKPFQDSCTPIVQVEFQSDDALYVGPDNDADGRASGEYLASYATSKGWTPEDALVVGATQPGLPPNLNLRISACADAIKAALPGVDYKEFSIGQDATTALTNMTDFLTANPDEHHMLVCTFADLFAMPIAKAMENAGRAEDGAVVGHLATAEGLEVIQAGNSPFVATVDYAFRQQPLYAMILAQDVVAGKPVPSAVYPPVQVIDKTNAADFLASIGS